MLQYLLATEESRTGKPYPLKEPSLLMKKIDKFETGPPDEMAKAAFARYKSFYKLLPQEIKDDTYALAPMLQKKDKQEIIANVEARIPIPIPESLQSFWTNHGAFSIGDKNEQPLQIFSATELLKMLTQQKSLIKNNLGLCSMLGYRWGVPPEVKDKLKIWKKLDEQYICFGMYAMNPDVTIFYYFDHEGRFGEVVYDQDYFEDFDTSYMTPLLKESKADKTFDQLISKTINCFIKETIDNCEIK